MRPETKNPFTNGKLIGAGYDPEAYHRYQIGLRGEKEYVMSRGALADFLRCPSKWKAGYESKDTNATRWGSLMDALVLSPEQMDERFAVYPSMYPCEPSAKDPRTEKPWNNNATYCKDWKKERDGKVFIHKEKSDEDGIPDEDTRAATLGNAERAKNRLLKDDRIASVLSFCKTQVMVTAEHKDRATGIVVPFKVLLDIVPNADDPTWGKTLWDFKTAMDASEREFAKAVHKGFYDWQAAIYSDCYTSATGEDRTDFLFGVQENTPPYEPAVWGIGADWISDARAEVSLALEFYCSCLASGHWPSYSVSTPIESYGLLSREAYMVRSIPRFQPSTPSPNPNLTYLA